MHELAALTPLGGQTPQISRVGAITIAEVTDRALASVSARIGAGDAFHTSASALFGCKLPDPGACVSAGDFTLIWTGADQWFVEAPFASHEDISRIVKTALGATASVTEQTDGWVRFDISGTTVVDMLERLCPVPARRMETGDATRSIVEHMGCFVICRAKGQHFSIIAPRSYAGSLHHTLKATAHSIA